MLCIQWAGTPHCRGGAACREQTLNHQGTRGSSSGSHLQLPNLYVQHYDNKQPNLSTKTQQSDFTVCPVSNIQSLLSLLNTVCSPCRSECSNCEVGGHCGVIMHGNAATFCEPYGPRELVSGGCPLCQGWGCRLGSCVSCRDVGIWIRITNSQNLWYLAEMLLNKVVGP